MSYRPKFLALVLLCAAALLLPGVGALADDPIAEVILKSDGVIFEPVVEAQSLVLTVNSPCGIVIRKEYDGRDTPTFALEELEVQNVDGIYKYRLEQTPFLSSAERELIADLRKNGDANDVARSLTDGRLPKAAPAQSGAFVVLKGAIITDTGQPEEGKQGLVAAAADDLEGLDFAGEGGLQSAPQADILHNDDVIIFRSLCVGFDCVNGEVFNADTIRLKENNLRIHFEDTSVAAGFPTTDWRLIANDQASGGASYFSIQDASANRRVFSVEANAPSHSLYVDNGGRVGIRTSNPVVDLHVSDGDTPTLRLEQTGASGFAPQTWDVAGNETSFFIRDATNGSTLPFRIRPGASSNALVIDGDDDVGIGVLSPEVELHILATGEAAADVQFKIEANTDPAFDFEEQDSGVTWRFINNNAVLKVADVGAGADAAEEFTLNQDGDLNITGEITTGGMTCGGGCDFVFSPEYNLPSIEEHAAQMWANSYLPAVGPTPENRSFNLTQKVGGMLNELEKAHIYIDQLNQRLVTKESELQAVKRQTEELQRTVEELKRLLEQ